jgi:hypothetical protein
LYEKCECENHSWLNILIEIYRITSIHEQTVNNDWYDMKETYYERNMRAQVRIDFDINDKINKF